MQAWQLVLELGDTGSEVRAPWELLNWPQGFIELHRGGESYPWCDGYSTTYTNAAFELTDCSRRLWYSEFRRLICPYLRLQPENGLTNDSADERWGVLDTVLALFGLDPLSIEASQRTTSNLLTTLQKSDAAGLKQCFWWPLRLLLTEKRTRKIWSGLESFLGPVETFTYPELHKDGSLGVRTMKSLVRFQRGRMAVSIRLWGNKVVGLGVRAPVTIGLTPKWEAPE